MTTPKRPAGPITKEMLASLGIPMAPEDSPIYKRGPMVMTVARRPGSPDRRPSAATPADPPSEDTETCDS